MSYAKNCLKMDNIDRLLDAIEHPRRYSDAEIEAMLQDPEAKEALETLDKTKSSLQPIATPDVDAEWKAFQQNHVTNTARPAFRIHNLFSQKVAATAVICLASFAAVAAVVTISLNHFTATKSGAWDTEAVADVITTVAEPDTVAVVEDIAAVTPRTIVFDNTPFETIISDIASYYGCTTAFSSDTTKSLRLFFRWDQNLPLESVVESLNNFERINICLTDKTIQID